MSDVPGVTIREDIAHALASGHAVVALETTLVVHGLPRPGNLAVAAGLEDVVRAHGAVPATIGVIDGTPIVGLDDEQLRHLTTAQGIAKVSVRDLPHIAALGRHGATTFAATAHLAARAGITIIATGGLGGVHREARTTWDESADLVTLARTPVVVVCSGVKSVLDVGATLQRLETLGVPVVGVGTQRFPGFYLTDSGFEVSDVVASPEQAAAVVRAQRRLGLADRGLVVANPLPQAEQLDPVLHDRLLADALDGAARAGVTGAAVTPYLLEALHRGSSGETVRVNVRLVRRNAELAARIARALVVAA